ncbi:MAG: hypothetical protein U1F53_06895 [Burkholderiaceae bacterium]
MRFYQEALGGSLQLTKLADTPMKDQFPVGKHQRIISAHLKSGAIEISASDWMASPAFDDRRPRRGASPGLRQACPRRSA